MVSARDREFAGSWFKSRPLRYQVITLGKLFTRIVIVAGNVHVTAGLAESNGSLRLCIMTITGMDFSGLVLIGKRKRRERAPPL